MQKATGNRSSIPCMYLCYVTSTICLSAAVNSLPLSSVIHEPHCSGCTLPEEEPNGGQKRPISQKPRCKLIYSYRDQHDYLYQIEIHPAVSRRLSSPSPQLLNPTEFHQPDHPLTSPLSHTLQTSNSFPLQ